MCGVYVCMWGEGGGCSKSLEKLWKMTDQHQYQKTLCVIKIQKGAGVLSACMNHWSLVCPSSTTVTFL